MCRSRRTPPKSSRTCVLAVQPCAPSPRDLLSAGLRRVIRRTIPRSANHDVYPIRVLVRARLQAGACQLEEIEAAHVWLVVRGVGASPGVECEMVMIAVPRDKACLSIEVDHQLKAKGLLVKGDALIQIADVEMHVTEDRAFWEAVKVRRFSQQRVGIEGERVHGWMTVA